MGGWNRKRLLIVKPQLYNVVAGARGAGLSGSGWDPSVSLRPQLCSPPRPLEPTTLCNYRKERQAVDPRTSEIEFVLAVWRWGLLVSMYVSAGRFTTTACCMCVFEDEEGWIELRVIGEGGEVQGEQLGQGTDCKHQGCCGRKVERLELFLS